MVSTWIVMEEALIKATQVHRVMAQRSLTSDKRCGMLSNCMSGSSSQSSTVAGKKAEDTVAEV